MTEQEAIDKLVEWANAQIGTTEGPDNWNKYADSSDMTKLYGWNVQSQPWCFTAGTLILTENGYKPIEEIKVGDSVLSANGDRFNRITHVAVHDAEVSDYRVYGALPFSVTPDHPFLSEKRVDKWHRNRGFKEWGYNPIETLNLGDMVAAPHSPVLYDDYLSYDDLWIVGYFVGDGHCSRRNEYVLCANETKAKKIELHANGHWDKDYQSRTCKQFNLYTDAYLREVLSDCGHGAPHKRVPKCVLFGSTEAKRAFLDGYLASDGCEKFKTFNSVSAELVTGIARLLFDIGGACSINPQKRSPQGRIFDKRLNAYRTFNQQEFLYNCSISVTDDGRLQHFITKDRFTMLPLRHIGETRIDTVYTLTTDGDHSYTANNIGVHNCDVFVDAGFISCFGFEIGSAMTYQYAGCNGAACRYSAEYYQQHGAFFQEPQRGDQVFFFSGSIIGHTGIVTNVGIGAITTVEGNSSDAVTRRTYSIDAACIAGYGRPNWTLAGRDIVVPTIPQQKPQEAPTEPQKPLFLYHDYKYKVNINLLKVGDYGPLVRNLQALLSAHGYDCKQDGEFTDETEEAVERFQSQNHLTVDGEVGGQTWTKLLYK